MPALSDVYLRHAGHYLRRAGILEQRFESGHLDFGAVQSELDLIWDQVLSAANWARSHSQNNRIGSILFAGFVSLTGTIAQLRMSLEERREWLEEASGLDAIREQEFLLCTLWCQLGNVYTELGLLAQAVDLYESANSLALGIDDDRVKVVIFSNLGNAYRRLCEYDSAVSCLEEAIHGCSRLGDKRSHCSVLLNLGHTYFQLGSIETANDHFRTALDLARSTGDTLLVTNAVGAVGSTFLRQGRFAAALPFIQDGLRLARSLGNSRDESLSLNDLAVANLELGKHEVAIALATEALEVGRQSGELRCQAIASGTLGSVNLYQKNLPLAVTRFRESLSLARALQDPILEGHGLANLGQALYDSGAKEDAILQLTAAVDLLEPLGDPATSSLRPRLNRWLRET